MKLSKLPCNLPQLPKIFMKFKENFHEYFGSFLSFANVTEGQKKFPEFFRNWLKLLKKISLLLDGFLDLPLKLFLLPGKLLQRPVLPGKFPELFW